jgi:hypothetical protein
MDTLQSPEEQSAVAIFSSREDPVVLLRSVSGCLGRDATVGKRSFGCCRKWQSALGGCLCRIVFRWPYRAKCGSGSSTLAPPSWRQGARLEHLYAWPVARLASRYLSIAMPRKCPPAKLTPTAETRFEDWTKGNARQFAELVRRRPLVAYALRKLHGRHDWSQAEQPAVLLRNSSGRPTSN